jgi:hypothetical protein
MATMQRRRNRGLDQAERISRDTGAEVRLARRGAGLSIRAAAASVGLRFNGRAYPDGDPVRDEAHTRLLQRFRDVLPAATPWRLEVPLPIAGDRRAWDAQCVLARTTIGIEAEMRLFDLQALDRRIALKRRDGGLGIVLLLIADTHANRRHLHDHREQLRPSFPLDTRAVLAAVRLGRAPAVSGLVVL